MSAVPSQYIGVYETLSGSHGDNRIDENRNRPARRWARRSENDPFAARKLIHLRA